MLTQATPSKLVLHASSNSSSNTTVLTLVAYVALHSFTSRLLFPYLRRWHEQYARHGLAIKLMVAPRFQFEQLKGHLQQYVDPKVDQWKATVYQPDVDEVWPRIELYDQTGSILQQMVGLSDCSSIEPAIRSALVSSGPADLPPTTVSGQHFHHWGTGCLPSQPELFTGLRRGRYKNQTAENLKTPTFVDPLDRATFGLSLQGRWNLSDEMVHTVTATGPDDYLSFVFFGFEVSAIFAPLDDQVATMQLTLDGQPVAADQAGSDILLSSQTSQVTVDRPRLYHLLRSSRYFAPGELRLYPNGSPVGIYLLTASGCRFDIDPR